MTLEESLENKRNNDILQWKKQVLERDASTCINCGQTHKVAACFIIPPEAGGRLVVSNGATICRDCRISAEGARVLPVRIEQKTPINFFISKNLHSNIENALEKTEKFGSLSSLVRRMISSFITEPELYEDLSLWQDDGSDVKINGWVDGNQYEVFKRMCQEKNISYTDAMKALLLMAIDGMIDDK